MKLVNSNLPSKRVGPHRYYLAEVLDRLEKDDFSLFINARQMAGLTSEGYFNVVKISEIENTITFLDYAGLHEEAFPQLRRYWRVDQSTRSVRFRTYESSLNPPILHRKELLLFPDHPRYKIYTELTTTAEQLGLFDDPNRIGFKRAWDDLVAKRGFKEVDHQLIPIGNDEATFPASTEHYQYGVARHLTALTRHNLSAPIQALLRLGFLDGTKSVFDYGCGRGNDVCGLRENHIVANGWDPHFAPNGEKITAEIVNLGFVINVIEDIDERIEALLGAYRLAEELLVIAAMIANQDAVSGTPYGDGVLTSRNTFQKYYTQGELGNFIKDITGEEPIPVGPGIYFLFKDKNAEQRFRYGRMENRRSTMRLSQISQPRTLNRQVRADQKYDAQKELLEALWIKLLQLGRTPDPSEVSDLPALIEAFGSFPAALRFIKSRKENVETVLEESRRSRIEDITAYFAQLQFERCKPYSQLETRLQKDIRAFFGDYRHASDAGRALLNRVAHIESIGNACHEASERGIGWLEDSEFLQLHTSLIEQLPPVLRAYIHCGTHLYGDVTNTDLIKIHIRSGKLTLMTFDKFTDTPLPKMIQRVKLNLRTQDLAIFDYTGAFEPRYLYFKSRYINEEFPHYAEQIAFEEIAEEAHLMDFSGFGPTVSEFNMSLAARRFSIDGFKLTRSQSIPDIDSPCGRYLTYRHLIQCGETQAHTQIENLPKEPDSYTALLELAQNVLDPVIDYFGMVKLTYGFSSQALAKLIPARISPELDQHAAHEKKRNGKFICERLGAACDFLVEFEDMEEVIRWIQQNIPFDRLYFIDGERPIHISYAPARTGQIVRLVKGVSGKLIPRVVKNV